LAVNVSAQQWSAEQQEVWKTIDATWQADKDSKDWVEEFVHPDGVGWSNARPMPSDKATSSRWLKAYKPIFKILEYQIFPLAIIVKGNVAIAHYYYRELYETYHGKKESEIGRFTETWYKEGNKWLLLGWQGCEDKTKE
jgi:hypothetical protein